MSQSAQEGLSDLRLEEIDDYDWLIHDLEEEENDSFNNTRVPDDNRYSSENNVAFRNGEIQRFTFPPENYQNSSTAALPNSCLASNANSFSPESPMDSFSSESASATDSLSSHFASSMVLVTSSASSGVSSPVKQRLNGMIKMKMRAEGRPDPPLTSSPKVVDQLTPEEERKKLEKQQRNKESARRSRQKKKEEDEKLLRDFKRLTLQQQKLKYDVALLNHKLDKYEEFFTGGHLCMLSPQQENGDQICVETGRSKVCDDSESADTEDKTLQVLEVFINDYGVSIPYKQGSASQQKLAILCQLDDDLSEMVTSATAYVPESAYSAKGALNTGVQENIVPNISSNVINHAELSLTANDGFGIGVQENIFPDLSDKVTSYKELETIDGASGGKLLLGNKDVIPSTQINNAESFGAYQRNTQLYNANSVSTYQAMSHGMSPMTGEVAHTNNYSVPMMKHSQTIINPWCTDDGNHSEAEEALKLVQGFSPPPVKKIRRE